MRFHRDRLNLRLLVPVAAIILAGILYRKIFGDPGDESFFPMIAAVVFVVWVALITFRGRADF